MSFRDRYGAWALVTGASSGIGREFAIELAKLNMNLVLVARRADRLREVSEHCGALGAETRTCVIDLAQPNGIEQLETAVSDLEIDMLVNSAGTIARGVFHKLDRARQHDMLYLNAVAPMMLSHHFLGGMVERRRGAVIFVSSTSAHYFHPYMATYAVSKTTSRNLGDHLAWELRGTGVDCLVVTPGATDTGLFKAGNMHVTNDTLPPGYRLQHPASVVKQAFKALGRKENVIVTGFAERVLLRLNSVLPAKLMRRLIASAAGRIE